MLTVNSANAEEQADDMYKIDITGQYVSKDVQVTDYDGAERPTRPKFDILNYSTNHFTSSSYSTDCVDCEMIVAPEEPCDGCGGGGGGSTTPTVTSTFVSSEGFGYAYYPYSYPNNPTNAIQDLKIIKGSSSSIGPLDGYFKINADLNRGAGGKYIYLQFTRDPNKVVGSSNWVDHYEMGRNVPVKDVHVESQTVGTRPQFYDLYWTPIETKDAFGYHQPDLNDGAGGKYIYSYQIKGNNSQPAVKEIGVIYGNSSSIQPPYGWVKIPGDLNEGAGGDFIYFCVKY